MTIVNDILKQMPGLGLPQRKFLTTLLVTILDLRGRVNFRTVGQGGHELFQWLVKPAIEGRAGHPGDRTFQIRSQNIGLVGSSRGTGRNDHGPYQHPKVQFALPLNDSALHAQSLNVPLWQNRLEHLSHVLTRHLSSLQRALAVFGLLMRPLGEEIMLRLWRQGAVDLHSPARAALSGHVCKAARHVGHNAHPTSG
jgi:hypothetical protein